MADLRILAFDTSGPHCAASLLIGDRIVASAHEDMRKGQAERLMPMLDEVMAEEGAVWEELHGIAVGVGPGNFTGIRIGVSAARGLALALGIPAIGVSTFRAMRGPLSREGHARQIVSIRGPRESVYLQEFLNGSEAAPPRLVQADPEAWQALPTPSQGTELIGPAAEALMLQFGGGATHLYPWTDRDIDWRRAVDVMARIAAERLTSGDVGPRPAPLYVRPADAAPASDPPPVILP